MKQDFSCKHGIGKECIDCEFWMGIGPEVHPRIYPGEGCAITALIEHEGLTLAEAIEEARRRKTNNEHKVPALR